MKGDFIYKYMLSFFCHTIKQYPKFYVLLIIDAILFSIITIFQSYILSILLYALPRYSMIMVIGIGICIACLYGGMMILYKWLKKVYYISQSMLEEQVQMKLGEVLTKIPYFYLEDEYYLDLIKKARYAIHNDHCIQQLLSALCEMLQCVFTIIGLFVIMIHFHYAILCILCFGLLCKGSITYLLTKIRMKYYEDNLKLDRKFEYYLDTLLNERHGKDFRLYALGKVLLNKYKIFIRQMLGLVSAYEGKAAKLKSALEICRYLELMVIYIMIMMMVVSQEKDVSYFTLYVSVATSFSLNFSRAIQYSMQILTNSKFMKPVIMLFQLQNTTRKEGKVLKDIESIEFCDVTFAYPNSSRKILDGVSFTIKKHEKVSIVGLNGSGKTTIVKLLCRLYTPIKGNIYINRTDITEYEEYEEYSYLQCLSVLFQDVKAFPFTIKDNLQMNVVISDKELDEILSKISLKKKMNTLKRGIDSIYYKAFEEDGVEFSGGELQRLAFGRVLARNTSFIILDEPTSALDPIAESRFYEDFRTHLDEKTVMFISHRMSSSMFSDKIIVLDKGKIVDIDTHENLMNKKESLYATLFQTQAQQYQ